jgi:hypothetical protein
MAVVLKKGGAKLSRTETVTVRLDPKLRFLADLASRKQRRTLSSFIEWAIEESLKNVYTNHKGGSDEAISFYHAADLVWDVNNVERLLKIAKEFPDLLNHEEQIIWKFIKEFSFYDSQSSESYRFFDDRGDLDIKLIRECWQEIIGVIDGSISEETLRKKFSDSHLSIF